MKNWFKQQVTEFTAWTGFALCVCSFLNLSYWVFFIFGIFLISIDDKKAATWCAEKAPKVSAWIDAWKAK